jgi:hypothetical protein
MQKKESLTSLNVPNEVFLLLTLFINHASSSLHWSRQLGAYCMYISYAFYQVIHNISGILLCKFFEPHENIPTVDGRPFS